MPKNTVRARGAVPGQELPTPERSSLLGEPMSDTEIKIPLPGKDYELKLPSDHLSWSQIELYLQDPIKYQFRYVHGMKEPKTPALAEGTAMTRLLELSGIRKIKKGKHLGLDDALKNYVKIADEEFKDLEDSGATERADKFLRELWSSGEPPFLPVMVGKKPGCEYEFNVEIAGVPVLGYVDLVENDRVIDYKVGKDAYRYDPQTSVQLDLYAVALGRTQVGYVVFEKKSGKIHFKNGSRHLKTAKRWIEITVSRVAQGISAGIFPPSNPAQNSLCSSQWCHFWNLCYGKV